MPFAIRRATLADLDVLSRHRCEMWENMGYFADEQTYEDVFIRCRPYFEKHLPTDGYVAWLVYPTDAPETIVAGGGAEIHDVMPYPNKHGKAHPTGRKAHIVNIFTERDYRRKGLGKMVMETIIDWCKSENIGQITLNASDEGRSLYEGLGFYKVENNMRLDWMTT